MLGAGARDAEGVGFLEGVAADELAGDLAGERDDGDGIHHGVDQAGDQVGGAGAGSGAADAHLAGGARIAFGGEAGIFFVADQHVADVVVVDGVVEGQGDAAGISEEAIHAFARQAFEQHFRAIHQSRHIFLNKMLAKKQKRPSAGLFRPADGLGTSPKRPQAGPATMTSTIIIMTTGRNRGNRLRTEKDRVVEPLDIQLS